MDGRKKSHKCISCGEIKSASAFYFPNSKNRRSRCAECRALYAEELKKKKLVRSRLLVAKKMGLTTDDEIASLERRLDIVAKNKTIPVEIFPTLQARAKGAGSVRRKTGLVAAGKVYPYQLFVLWQAQKFICPISGKDLTLETAHLDHIVPINSGGTNKLDNLIFVDAKVNQHKRDMPLELYCQWKGLDYITIVQNIAQVHKGVQSFII
jgi:hypothetical protein